MIETTKVTQEQIDACHRVKDIATQEVYYEVASATTQGIYYTVRYLKGKGALTCSCPAGNPPLNAKGYPVYAPRMCWHRRAALAHARLFRANQKAEREEMLKRIEEAEKHPYQWHEREVKRDQERFQGRPFKLMR